MKRFNLLISDAKDFMANEVNRLFVWVLILNIGLLCWQHFEIISLKKHQKEQIETLNTEIQTLRKRIDYRYFNITRTMEDMYGIKVDTHTGEIKHNL
ncbi:hypothetical protein IKP85_05575 [bacterium]|nr:hypothetical protein [bacterium]